MPVHDFCQSYYIFRLIRYFDIYICSLRLFLNLSFFPYLHCFEQDWSLKQICLDSAFLQKLLLGIINYQK